MSLGHSGSWKELKMSARSCDQLCPITWDMYTDHQGTDDQCALMISVAQKCHLSVPISATCQCPSMPHISATYHCQSVPVSVAYQCASVPPISAIYQCHVSVLPFSAHQ
ncbi:unnamed protein product [Staurois parvus]|uniref:Uncharacterized protein n=1 Tax=Staurois parvus TaxID=386267 RepID=A0ABN9HB47_9NEOB|nr:unnamed protein product [Staurois parvus]